MTEDARYQVPSARSPRTIRLVELSAGAMSALVDGDLPEAGRLAGVPLTAYFVTPGAQGLWRHRLELMAAHPGRTHWITPRAVVCGSGPVVGNGGFHGPPDEAGTIEVGYSVDPEFRRRGYARATVGELLRWSAADPAVSTVRARIAPDNTASLATISGFGFTEVGEQVGDDGVRRLVFEVPA